MNLSFRWKKVGETLKIALNFALKKLDIWWIKFEFEVKVSPYILIWRPLVIFLLLCHDQWKVTKKFKDIFVLYIFHKKEYFCFVLYKKGCISVT